VKIGADARLKPYVIVTFVNNNIIECLMLEVLVEKFVMAA